MTVATFAIAGIPPFAGFFSKDEILWTAVREPVRQVGILGGRRAHRLPDRVLHVPAVVPDLLRRIPRRDAGAEALARRARRRSPRPHPREPQGDAGPAGRVGVLSFAGGWIGWPQPSAGPITSSTSSRRCSITASPAGRPSRGRRPARGSATPRRSPLRCRHRRGAARHRAWPGCCTTSGRELPEKIAPALRRALHALEPQVLRGRNLWLAVRAAADRGLARRPVARDRCRRH